MIVQHLAYAGAVKDARGNVIPKWSDPVAVECVVAPRDSSESATAGYENRTIDALTLLEVPVAVAARDRFIVNGTTYDVEGIPFQWDVFDPFPPFVGVGAQVALKAVTG